MPPSLVELQNAVKELWVDVYKGKDHENPSIVSRLLMLEQNMTEMQETVKSINNGIRAIMYIGITAIVGAVINIIVSHYK